MAGDHDQRHQNGERRIRDPAAQSTTKTYGGFVSSTDCC
jgi:hypothetical protein